MVGRRKRDEFYTKNNLDFGVFWFWFFHRRAAAGSKNGLLKFKAPIYDYEFFCRANKDDFKLMTVHEDEIINKFTPESGDIVIDVGAHIGLYTIIGSRRVGLRGKVISLEPHPDNYNILKRNIELNHLNNVIALNSAASSSKSSIKLYLPGEDKGFTKLYTIMPNRAVTQNFVEVDANTLDDILQALNIEQVNWIKIDVEGAELEVLKGTTGVIRRSPNMRLLLEIHNIQGVDLYTEITRFLDNYGFDLVFEKSYDNKERHVLFAKENLQQKVAKLLA